MRRSVFMVGKHAITLALQSCKCVMLEVSLNSNLHVIQKNQRNLRQIFILFPNVAFGSVFPSVAVRMPNE